MRTGVVPRGREGSRTNDVARTWYMENWGPPAMAGVMNHAACVSFHPNRLVYTRDSGVMSAWSGAYAPRVCPGRFEKDTPSLRASTAAYGDADAIDARVGDADANNTNANANAALERISPNIASGPARARQM